MTWKNSLLATERATSNAFIKQESRKKSDERKKNRDAQANNQMTSYYSTSHWKRLSQFVKKCDSKQCQICGDREGRHDYERDARRKKLLLWCRMRERLRQ
jgi:hypothetical protein